MSYGIKHVADENDVIARLKFLGKIKPNDKINVKKIFIQPDTILSRISRTFLHIDDRDNTLTFVTTVIRETFELLSNVQADRDKINNIFYDLEEALKGLRNLIQTYINDNYFCCRLEVLIQDIEVRCKELQNRHQFLTKNSSLCDL